MLKDWDQFIRSSGGNIDEGKLQFIWGSVQMLGFFKLCVSCKITCGKRLGKEKQEGLGALGDLRMKKSGRKNQKSLRRSSQADSRK